MSSTRRATAPAGSATNRGLFFRRIEGDEPERQIQTRAVAELVNEIQLCLGVEVVVKVGEEAAALGDAHALVAILGQHAVDRLVADPLLDVVQSPAFLLEEFSIDGGAVDGLD